MLEAGLIAPERTHQLEDPALRTEALEGCFEALAAPDHPAERVAMAAELTRLGRERGVAGSLLRGLTTRVCEGSCTL